MATILRPLRTVNRLLTINLRPELTRTHRKCLYTGIALRGRSFFIDTSTLERVEEEAAANPFPVRYMEFTACQELYEVLAMHGMNKPASGVKFNIAYIDTNPDAKKSKPIVVCLHGTPGGHWDFNHLTIHLSNQGFRVIAINFPGYGWTKMDEYRQFENSAEEKASFVKDFLYSLGIEKVEMGIVHSAGVYPGLLLASEAMNIFESLALINPGGLGYHKALRPYWLLRFHARFYRNPIFRPFLLIALKLSLMASGFGNTNALQMSVAIESLASIPYDEYKAYPVSMAMRQYPSIFIHSVNDRVVETELSDEFGSLLAGSAEHSRFMYDEEGRLRSSEADNAKITHMSRHIFDSGGHFLMKRYPQTVNEIIEKFLKNLISKKKLNKI